MPVKKKKSVSKKSEMTPSVSAVLPQTKEEPGSSLLSSRTLLIIGVVVLVLALFVYKKEWFVAAVVDNRPIFTWDVNSAMQKRFGTRVLDEMVDTILINEEAEKEGVAVSAEEIETKVKEVEKQVGGTPALTNFLNLQGLTQEDLRNQLRLKSLVDKILAKKVTVSEKEIQDFLDKNKDSLPATDAAGLKKIAGDSLKEQKTSEEFSKWYNSLKAKAKIYRFL